MKIGILTFHCAHNYGAVLQCYALQETLKQMGHDVEVIDYRPEYLLAPYRRFDVHRFISRNPLKMAKKCVTEIVLANKRIIRYDSFNRFITKELRLSEKTEGKSIPQKYDVYVMGSDQIWNPKITNGFDPVYFGDFGFPKDNKKYVAYAASMGATSLEDDAKAFYMKALKSFDSVSVREIQLAALLQPLTDKKVEIVLDPTLLVDRNLWSGITKTHRIKEKYVLVYQVRYDSNTLRIAYDIAKEIGAVVVEITAFFNPRLKKNRLQCASPEEFIGWIGNASCVVTTSFHGTAFSVIFNKPFYCIALGDNGDSRSASLLKNIGLEDRMINKNDSPGFSGINYDHPNAKLSLLKEKSKEYLLKAISE